jgi:hypothetical protein
MEQPFELGESGNNSYLDQEAPTSISRGSSLQTVMKIGIMLHWRWISPLKGLDIMNICLLETYNIRKKKKE